MILDYPREDYELSNSLSGLDYLLLAAIFLSAGCFILIRRFNVDALSISTGAVFGVLLPLEYIFYFFYFKGSNVSLLDNFFWVIGGIIIVCPQSIILLSYNIIIFKRYIYGYNLSYRNSLANILIALIGHAWTKIALSGLE